MSPAPGQILSHYRLIEKVGEGGMGVVWKAEDTVLGRTVAIKVLPADAARDERRRRMFFDEARLASSLNEAHIAQVYEFAREGDLEFIVMEFVEGKPLSRILQSRPLAPERVADIGIQAAKALSRAHRKNLLHRDLKPSNIMITGEGEVKVVDFGLARLFAPAEAELGTEAPTRTLDRNSFALQDSRTGGGPAGTLPYMSPEQARGEKLDSRSDIFSLGVVLYEATSGQRPFWGTTPEALIREILRAHCRPVHELVPRVPLELERIIQKTLAAKPAERYQTMDDLAVDLKRLSQDLESGTSPSYDEVIKRPGVGGSFRRWVPILVVLLALAGWVVFKPGQKWWSGIFHPVEARSVLCLPFETVGQEEGGGYLGRAFAEALAINLSQAKDLQVLPVPSDEELKGVGSLARIRAAAELGAGRLLYGSMRRDANTLHVSLSLVDTAGNRILWGAQGDAEDASLTGLAASFARQAAVRLGSSLLRRYDYPRNLIPGPEMANTPYFAEAMAAVLRSDHQRALAATRRLVENFPREVDARALRVYEVHQSTVAGFAKREELEKEIEALERLDPGNATAQNIRCELLLNFDRRVDDAVQCSMEMLQRADLTPAARAWALRDRAGARNASGDTLSALNDLTEALSLDPTSIFAYTMRGDLQAKRGDFHGAEASFRQSLALAPEGHYVRRRLADVLEAQGRIEESLSFAAGACDRSQFQSYCATYAVNLLKAGRRDDALAAARHAATLTHSPQNGDFELAGFWVLAGDPDEAIRSFQRFTSAIDASDILDASRETSLAPLRDRPEFKRIVADAARRRAAEKDRKTP